MAGEKQMVPGFNHNVKHKGTPYHVQTEDSGVDNPRIITHLFVGGNVIASKKTSYADIVGAENLAQVVRELMEEQHKEMLRNLISGVYDDTDEELAAKARAFQPGQIAGEPERPSAPPIPEAPPEHPAARAPKAPATPRAPQPAPAAAHAAPARPPPIPRPAPQGARQPAAIAAQPARGQPPRPGAVSPAATSAAPASEGLLAPQRAAAPAPAAVARAAPSSAERRDGLDALFGEDLISEKSLDEVILSYLAEDQAGKA